MDRTKSVPEVLAYVAGKLSDSVNAISEITGVRAVVAPLKHPKRPGCKTLLIPGYRQVQTYTCGFIAAANVLHLYHPEVDLSVLYSILDHRDGTEEFQVADGLRTYGIEVERRTTLDFCSICQALVRGSPIIAAVRTIFYGHWIVIYGYDSRKQTVFICGNGYHPVLNRKEVSFDHFCTKWDPAGNGLICTPGTPKNPPRPHRKIPKVRIAQKWWTQNNRLPRLPISASKSKRVE
jgi:hypothetical protein